MADLYLSRASAAAAPSPLISVIVALAVPVIVVFIGRTLITTVSVDSTSYAVSYSSVRTAITQVLDKELTADRIQEVLAELRDPTPGVGKDAQDKRKTDRATRLKAVAARLNGERGRLVDKLMSLVLVTHPGLPGPDKEPQPLKELRQAVGATKDPGERRKLMASFVAALFDSAGVRQQAAIWVGESIDDRARAALANAVAPPNEPVAATLKRRAVVAPKKETEEQKKEAATQVAAKAVAELLPIGALQRAAAAVIDLPFRPFETRPGESAWASDVAARLGWALVAIVFMLTFAAVAFSSLVQLWRISPLWRWVLIAVTVVAAYVAGEVSRDAFSPGNGLTPLHVALADYAQLFRVGILEWSARFNALRGAGVAILVVGAVATFWLKVATAQELNEQLRGFKALFNAGAVFLAVGTFEVYAAFRWPVVFAADETTRTALQGAATAFALTVGAGFSVVMLATYYVTTFVLRQQALARTIPADDVKTAFETFGFSDLTSDQFLRVAQALAPLLPGAVTLLLS